MIAYNSTSHAVGQVAYSTLLTPRVRRLNALGPLNPARRATFTLRLRGSRANMRGEAAVRRVQRSEKLVIDHVQGKLEMIISIHC